MVRVIVRQTKCGQVLAWVSLIVVALVNITGCASALPSEKKSMVSGWSTFDEAKASYDLIIPNYTTVTELKELGFDPFSTPNVRILTYLDIIQRFIPNTSLRISDLNEGIQRCIHAREACYAYEATPNSQYKKRYGNVALDVMNFRKQTQISGWSFDALIVIIDDQVVYKIWGGTPMSLEYGDKKNPLGPLQGIKDLIK